MPVSTPVVEVLTIWSRTVAGLAEGLF